MNLKYFGMVVLGLAALNGCGKGANAKKQSVETLDLPAYPAINNNVFALTGGKTSVTYKSTMLILNPTGNPALLAEVIRVSEETRVKAAKSKAFMLNEARFMPGGSAEAEVAQKKDELNKFLDDARKDLAPVPLAERQENAKGWLAAKTSGLGLSAEANDAFQASWNGYCDAKIVELAVHPEFAARSVDGYRQRPSPQQFCEPYYEERGYFKGESCTNGDYFSCLWIDGVMKSGSEASQTALAALLDPVFSSPEKTTAFRSLLASTKDVTGPYIKDQASSGIRPPVYKLLSDDIFLKQHYFSKALLSDKPSTGTETLCKQLMIDTAFDFICGSFAKTWNAQPAQSYINALENDRTLVSNHPSLKGLVDVAKYFGTRPMDGSLRISNSDFYFHDFTGALPAEPNASKLGLTPEELDAINAEFTGKVFPGLSKQNLEAKAQREQAIAALEDEIKQKRKQNEELTLEANEAIQQGIRAATEGDVAYGFLAYFMTVSHYDNIMRATISFDGFPTQIFEGCYDKDQQLPIDCPVGIGNPGRNDVMHKATLNLVPERGRIDFSFLLEDPDAVGLGHKPKVPENPEYFMNLKSEELKGKTLRFELYPNRLENSLDILTGKTLFTQDGRDVYEAGLSMWEV